MKTFEWEWRSFDNLTMYSKCWAPEKEPRAVVCLVHGLGEHIGRYEHVGRAFTDAGYALLGFDHRGHGRSGGQRGHTPAYEALLDDMAALLRQAGERYPARPYFLYGHSMGGNLVINYALRRKADLGGVIATGPFLKLAFQPPAVKVALGRMMNNIAPGFTQTSGLETAALSRDSNVVQAYINDPLVHNKISARLFVSLFDSGQYAFDHPSEFPLPMLLMHGSADRLTSAAASRQFGAAAPAFVTMRLWDGFFHEIHNEPEKDEVLKAMIAWLDGQVKAK
ncbi:MAG: Monoacylglycerol lipase [Anaerolineales bacterium]|nr:Monoacylglycerol lipase [Anaerolineales bacterium]